jgi:hypothetical protein
MRSPHGQHHYSPRVPQDDRFSTFKDIERWLAGKSERAVAIESGSGSNVTDYVAHDGSNKIAVTADVQDLDALQAMLASPPPEMGAAMEAHGVVPPISAYVAAD